MSAPETRKPRWLKGHKSQVSCCVASRDRPGVVVSSGEDGCICLFDLRSKDVLFTMDVQKGPIPSICFESGDENVIYACSGTEVVSLDMHMLEESSWKPLQTYNHNKEEINQVACRPKSSYLAAADDSGDVKIMNIHQHCLYKTLRSVHTNICTSVQFLPWRPWEAVTGGLDAKLVLWDFSRGRALNVVDFGMSHLDLLGMSHLGGSGSNSKENRSFNPPFVHALSVPDMDMLDRTGKICAVARGDGLVNVIALDTEQGHAKAKSQLRIKRHPQRKTGDGSTSNQGKCLQLDYEMGRHAAAVSCVAFSLFGESGRYVISGSNDKFVKVWDWSKHSTAGANSSRPEILHLNVTVGKKVNWLCTTPADSENLVVCDTSRVLKVFSIA